MHCGILTLEATPFTAAPQKWKRSVYLTEHVRGVWRQPQKYDERKQRSPWVERRPLLTDRSSMLFRSQFLPTWPIDSKQPQFKSQQVIFSMLTNPFWSLPEEWKPRTADTVLKGTTALEDWPWVTYSQAPVIKTAWCCPQTGQIGQWDGTESQKYVHTNMVN